MNPNAAVNLLPQNTRFAGFLAAAVLLHALLMLLPADRDLPPETVLHRLSVSLRAITAPPPAPEAATAQGDPVPAAENARPAPPAATPRPQPAEPSTPPQSAVRVPAPALSTARLLDYANRTRWTLPEGGEPRRLGEHAPIPPRERARPGAVAAGSGRSGTSAPAVLEVVDRWLAADGSHNVLIHTSSGRLLCGRAERWDPMQPLVEHVMRYRDCGAGEPTFEWPESYRAKAPPPP